MTEYCAVIGLALHSVRQQRSYQTPSLSCGMGCGHTRLKQRATNKDDGVHRLHKMMYGFSNVTHQATINYTETFSANRRHEQAKNMRRATCYRHGEFLLPWSPLEVWERMLPPLQTWLADIISQKQKQLQPRTQTPFFYMGRSLGTRLSNPTQW